MINIGIIGGAGYTAGELLRIVLQHPQANIVFVHSNSHSGKPITSVHTDLIGETEIHFSDFNFSAIDVLFLCTGHGASKKFLAENPVPESVKIIDLSEDFRLIAEKNDFVYGLPELNKEAIQSAQHIANPGCFATAIQLAILPLAALHHLTDEIHINATTGSTGAGQAPSATTHYSWRNNNLSVYKAFEHQHLREIKQNVGLLQPNYTQTINFIPQRGCFARGILAAVYTQCDLSLEEAKVLYKEYYSKHPFTIVSDSNPDLKQVVNTNKCVLYLEKHNNKLLIISVIDNLTKGASGQAVQNMNLLFGLDETTGLKLKTIGF